MYGWMQSLTAAVVLVVVVNAVVDIEGAKLKTLKETDEESAQVTYNWVAFKEDVQIRSAATAFQVGNVFYEILFAAAMPEDNVTTFCYFGLAMPTLGLGIVNVIIASHLSYVFTTLPTAEKK